MSSFFTRHNVEKSFKKSHLTANTICKQTQFHGNVTLLMWVCHILVGVSGVSNFCGCVKLVWVCHTFVGMSGFKWYVTLLWVGDTFVGMSCLCGYVTLFGEKLYLKNLL